MDRSRLLVALGFVLMGVMSRLIPHPPNFTAITAMALLGTFYLGDRKLALLAIFSCMLLSDGVWGVHSTMVFVYASFGLVVWMGFILAKTKSLYLSPLFSVAGSLVFFGLTNFGIWLTGEMYPQTWQGFCLCYVAALPFLANQVLGDLFYGALIIGSFSLIARFFPHSSFKPFSLQDARAKS